MLVFVGLNEKKEKEIKERKKKEKEMKSVLGQKFCVIANFGVSNTKTY